MDTARMVEAYIVMRDLKAAIKERHTAELAPLNERMQEFENKLLDHLNQINSESVRTKSGTVYKSTRTQTKVDDWEVCLANIREHGLWHLLEKRVAKSAVEEIVAHTGLLPPGVSMTSTIEVNIRSS